MSPASFLSPMMSKSERWEDRESLEILINRK